MRTALTLAAVLASTPAWGGDWLALTTAQSGEEFFYDIDRFEARPNRAVRYWVKSDTTKATRPPAYASSMVRYEVQCGEKTLLPLSVTRYDRDGRVVSSEGPGPAPRTPPPESVGEHIVTLGCIWLGEKADPTPSR